MSKQKSSLKLFLPFILIFLIISIFSSLTLASDNSHITDIDFPRNPESYLDKDYDNIYEIISHRISEEPFNLVATLIFFLAIIHTFLTNKFTTIANQWDGEHKKKKESGKVHRNSIHFGAGIFRFLGEIEAVFGIWAIGLGISIVIFYDWQTVVYYIGHKVNYFEPLFVVVIMTIASSRPILKMFELLLWKIARLLGGTLEAWWIVLLTLSPLFGSLITGPAAMTITACLLADKFYDLNPPLKLRYATLALLFVNVSVGGTLTNFAAPPVLMVAGKWDWSLSFMFWNFGWKAIIGIVLANGVYFWLYRKDISNLKETFAINRFKKHLQGRFIHRYELEDKLEEVEYLLNLKLGFTEKFSFICEKIKAEIREKAMSSLTSKEIEKYDIDNVIGHGFNKIKKDEIKKTLPGLLPKNERPPYRDPNWDIRSDKVPIWIMIVHVIFMIWSIINAHEPVLLIGGFLFFLGFAQVTVSYQNRINLKPPLMVAFFLAGLVIHGGLQAWWISPILGSLSKIPLMIGATFLTAFNDNAAITYLCTFVTDFSPELKYAVVAGALAGGGLTIIANAPNPAGISILKKYFQNNISPLALLKAAVIPTLILWLCFCLL